MRTTPLVAAAVTLALQAAACAREGASAEPDRTVRVFAAQSLEKSLREICAEFERANAGDHVELHMAGSQILAAQIEEGASADMVITADEATMARLSDKQLVTHAAPFAKNVLVLAVPAASTLAAVPEIGKPGVKVVMAGDKVPVGKYAREALGKIGLREAVEKNVVSNEESVAGVVTKLTLGEADAGFVYATDVLASAGQLRAIPLPPEAAADVRYLRARAKGFDASAPDAVDARFEAHLLGPGAEHLRAAGFVLP
jgi:molybdate transport system substrate-binding protein